MAAGRIDRQGEIGAAPAGPDVMTKILSFFGFVFGFVIISIALAGVSQQAGKVVAKEDTQTACADSMAFDDGYGLKAVGAGICQIARD
jgi:hypothetical protein